jgi:hypothetical protein
MTSTNRASSKATWFDGLNLLVVVYESNEAASL